MLRDLGKPHTPDIAATLAVIAHAQADILLLVGLDYDAQGTTMAAFANAIAQAGGPNYTYRFAARPNTGASSGFDLDRNGKLGEPRDAIGYGTYSGQGGLALLSRHPIRTDAFVDFTSLLWRDLPGATLPKIKGKPFYTDPELDVLRLSSTAHWALPVTVPDIGPIALLAFAATPPVFDGPEDRNGLRNRDEVRLWSLFLSDALDHPAPDHPAIVMGVANLDPERGQGDHAAINALRTHPRVTDPFPENSPTVRFQNAGDMRVDYVLPDPRLRVVGHGVDWPDPDDTRAAEVATASRHRLVWIDIAP